MNEYNNLLWKTVSHYPYPSSYIKCLWLWTDHNEAWHMWRHVPLLLPYLTLTLKSFLNPLKQGGYSTFVIKTFPLNLLERGGFLPMKIEKGWKARQTPQAAYNFSAETRIQYSGLSSSLKIMYKLFQVSNNVNWILCLECTSLSSLYFLASSYSYTLSGCFKWRKAEWWDITHRYVYLRNTILFTVKTLLYSVHVHWVVKHKIPDCLHMVAMCTLFPVVWLIAV